MQVSINNDWLNIGSMKMEAIYCTVVKSKEKNLHCYDLNCVPSIKIPMLKPYHQCDNINIWRWSLLVIRFK